jgi:hypothetical protein
VWAYYRAGILCSFYNFQCQYLNNSNIIETEIKELFVDTGMISDLNSFFSTLTNEIIEKLNSDFSNIQLLNSNDHKLSFWDQISKLLSDTEDSINLKLQKGLTDEISSEFHFSANTINPKSHKIKNFGTNSIPNKILDRPDQPNILNKQDKKQKRKIIFTVWPLPINILEKTKSESSIPYITLYNLNKEEGGEFISTLPSNWETVQRKQSFGKTFENLFDYLAPLRGGFIWPGSTKPNLNLIQ